MQDLFYLLKVCPSSLTLSVNISQFAIIWYGDIWYECRCFPSLWVIISIDFSVSFLKAVCLMGLKI